MRTWPHGSAHVPVEVLAVGDIVAVPGAGAFRINRLLNVSPLGVVAVLGWDDLALILRRGTTRERLNPAPEATCRRRHAATRAAQPTAPEVSDQYPLVG